MIVKMKFLSITGPRADIDRVVSDYLSRYEIHLENALSELQTVQNLRSFIEINPYKEWLTKLDGFIQILNLQNGAAPKGCISLEKALDTVKDLDAKVSDYTAKKMDYQDERDKKEASLKKLEPFREFPYDLEQVMNFQFIKYRFGRVSRLYLNKLQAYVNEEIDTVFYRCNEDDQYIWGIYFVPNSEVRRVDAVYSSMHFERYFLPNEYAGVPNEVYKQMKEEIAAIDEKIADCDKKIRQALENSSQELLLARKKISSLSTNFDVRKLAACTAGDDKDPVYYILCGWMTEDDANAFLDEIKDDKNLLCMVEDSDNQVLHEPPTKLKNPKIVKPFEMFIRMYGLPAYNEFDPTIFVALTYAFIFGAMFGDVGQGLCLAIGGALLYHFKKIDVAGCIGCAGIFSTIFGFLYGSFFGFEDVLPALWLKPKEAMATLPFVGTLNTVFVVAIAFGMFLILLTMVFHIINGFRAKDVEGTFFDTNGIAGLVFYGAVVTVIFLFMTGHTLPGAVVLAVMFGLPLLVIFFKEPLSKLAEHRSDAMPQGKGMFLLTSFFELFEVILSYFSNTLSFVRIGAFAVSHAAMMEVVLMLAGYEGGGLGSTNWIVVVLGNLFVCGMEGLIVGIQVLRLEYYEMFSRFYKGSGKPFVPFVKKSGEK
ncbi:MAG TPA: ATPase [Candidatus Merdiplasma excrementigallinarum]|uniref:ATPase n=1 Tax=Candidatus Merdiplasma excrementigallinarum TaxID=2840864 RepID=A0A9D1NYM2_9FIRM|nr:ATPase [Candidatus Merdiplasma excrementigallinarum]